MTIGYIKQEDGNIRMTITLPFIKKENFFLKGEKNKEHPNAPDFKIFYMLNDTKNVQVGGIWNKTSKNGTAYKSMTLEHPLFPTGKLNASIFAANEDEKDKAISHNVVWSPPKREVFDAHTQAPTVSDEDYKIPEFDNEEIPF